MRHNTIYISNAERSDGQTEKARSENAGAETDWRPQPSPRLCFRHFVPRESILRSQGSSPGPLRDAAPTQRGESLDRRCGYQVWRFAPNRLSGPGCIPASRLLSGLLPKHRGPKEGHKLSAYVVALRTAEPGLTTVACVQAVQEKFGITVHRRSLERALASKKKPRNPA